jgi:hypothetical protein
MTIQEQNLTPPLSYENFDLRIHFPIGRYYPIEASAESLVGQSQRPVLQFFPLDEPDFEEQLALLGALEATAEEMQQFGEQLRELLFPAEIWNMFYASRTQTDNQGKGLRIRLRIDPPELSHLPWEYCYDKTFHHLALSRESPIVRYINEPFAPDSLTTPRPLKLLLAIASPHDLEPLAVEEEVERIKAALAPVAEQIELHILRQTTAQSLHEALINHEPHLLHFIGHGLQEDGKGYLALEDKTGNMHAVDAEQLLVLLHGRCIKVVVLNACNTASYGEDDIAIMGIAPALVRAQIPAVIAMQFALPDDIALLFSRTLYSALAKGLPLDTAVTEMRIAAYTSSDNRVDWGIPTLFMRSPNGILWPSQEDAAPSNTNEARGSPSEEKEGDQGIIVKEVSDNSSVNIQIGGDFSADRTTTNLTNKPQPKEPPALNELQKIRRQFQALRWYLPPEDAADIVDDLEEAQEMLTDANPNRRRITRRLKNIIETLEESDSTGKAASKLVPKLKNVIAMV